MDFGACFQSSLISSSKSVHCIPLSLLYRNSLRDVELFFTISDCQPTYYMYFFYYNVSSNKSCGVISALGTEQKSKR
jgi:hypothetical protein